MRGEQLVIQLMTRPPETLTLEEIYQEFVGTNQDDATARQEMYQQRWLPETRKLAEKKSLDQHLGVLIGFLITLDKLGLEEFSKDTQENGLRSAHARLLEAAFQCNRKAGSAYRQAERCGGLQGATLTSVYVMLVLEQTGK